MIVAMMVSSPSFAVVQQTVSALFQRQRPVRAQVELVAVFRVSVRLHAKFFRTFRAVFLAQDHCKILKKTYTRRCKFRNGFVVPL